MKISDIGDNLVVGMFALAAGMNFASMEELRSSYSDPQSWNSGDMGLHC